MSKPITGGCRCGAVRYECTAEPALAGNCHCKDCQQASGTDKNSMVGLPGAAFQMTGEITEYSVKADSGNIATRGFCPTCGAPITGHTSGMTDLIMVTAGSLDDPSVFQPQMDVFTASAQTWDIMDPDLPKFPGMPEMPE